MIGRGLDREESALSPERQPELDILLRDDYRPDPCIVCEEVHLVNVADALVSELLDLVTVRSLEWGEAGYIKRLQEMGGMSWHAESDDPVLCTILVELRHSVAAMTV